jgi:hypothetical protein
MLAPSVAPKDSKNEFSTDLARACELEAELLRKLQRRADRLFAGLLAVEWAAGVALAFFLSKRLWAGAIGQTDVHLWMAFVAGAALVVLPIWLAFARGGEWQTRHSIAAAQMLMAGLLVQLTAGRLETHFYVFTSLALLAVYRDIRLLATATAVILANHIVRGLFWPASVFGSEGGDLWRCCEYALWIALFDVCLIWICRQGRRDIRAIARGKAALEKVRFSTQAPA